MTIKLRGFDGHHSTYYGCNIYRQTGVGVALGYAMRWTARTPLGSVAADTLEGVKRCIRADLIQFGQPLRVAA